MRAVDRLVLLGRPARDIEKNSLIHCFCLSRLSFAYSAVLKRCLANMVSVDAIEVASGMCTSWLDHHKAEARHETQLGTALKNAHVRQRRCSIRTALRASGGEPSHAQFARGTGVGINNNSSKSSSTTVGNLFLSSQAAQAQVGLHSHSLCCQCGRLAASLQLRNERKDNQPRSSRSCQHAAFPMQS